MYDSESFVNSGEQRGIPSEIFPARLRSHGSRFDDVAPLDRSYVVVLANVEYLGGSVKHTLTKVEQAVGSVQRGIIRY